MSDYLLAFWNLENLFAPENHPDRIDWIANKMKKDLDGWSDALFSRKIAQLSSIIVQMKEGHGPDILGVCEVENHFVLEKLAASLNAALPGRTYAVAHEDSARDQRGIDTAFLFDSSRFTANPDLVFSHFVMRRTGTRDILQATFTTTNGNDLVVLANHWPSRSGGAQESRGFRQTAGETLGYWHERIQEVCGSNCAVVAFGDFNDDPFDDSITINARATRELGDVQRANKARFFNCSWSYLTTEAIDRNGKKKTLDGTLYFGGNGNIFDQILISSSLVKKSNILTAQLETARIETFPEMVSHKVSEGPIRFGLPKGNPDKYINVDGFSDHFPVSIIVREKAIA